jgi:hypothetical protein
MAGEKVRGTDCQEKEDQMSLQVSDLAIQTIKDTTTAIVTKYMEAHIDALMERNIRDVIREELQSLMKDTENVFVTRVAEALVEKVTEKLNAGKV